MPKQNRSLVKDGRIQPPKKRTDRSYLRPDADATHIAPPAREEMIVDEPVSANEPIAAFAPPTATASFPAPARASAGRLPTTVRAIQQQGVRKRRDVDLSALARRDTSYAYHELRRIAVLATMVIVTLVVLWFVLR